MSVEAVRALLPGARAIAVLTGAGISAESGIATFRDQNGLWENHRIEDVASPEGFERNPALVHRGLPGVATDRPRATRDRA